MAFGDTVITPYSSARLSNNTSFSSKDFAGISLQAYTQTKAMFDFVSGLPYSVTLQFLSWYSDTAGATSVPLDSRCLSCGTVRFGPKCDP